jgi:hypothetical protein
MRIVATILGATAGFVFIAASAAMNWMFMIAHGKTVLEGQVLGLVSIAIDVVKALMPFFIGAAWAHRQWLRTLLGACVFGLFFSFSLLSALGFVATNRGAVANSRAALFSQLESARKELGETEARLAALGMTKPEGEIDADIARLEQDRHWQSWKTCAGTNPRATRQVCAQIFGLEAELARAHATGELRARIDILKPEIKSFQDRGAWEGKDPQAVLLARFADLEVSQAQQALSVFIAALVEVGAASTLYLTLASGAPVSRLSARDIEAMEIKAEANPRFEGDLQDEERFRLPESGRLLLFG